MVEKLFVEKSALIMDKLIYPNNLLNILRKQLRNKKPIWEFLGDDYVRLIVVCDINEERLDESSRIIQSIFIDYCKSCKSLMIDEKESVIQFESIEKQISNGISEKAFYDWFMRLVFNCRQMTVPLDSMGSPKEGHNPSSSIVSFKYENGLISNFIFFTSNGSLLNEVTFDELIKKGHELLKKRINNSGKNKIKSKKRNPLDSKLRHECFKRDGYKCKECGASKEEKTLHCDHIISVAQGGSDELDNLQTLCDDCNLAKSDKCWIGGKNEKEK